MEAFMGLLIIVGGFFLICAALMGIVTLFGAIDYKITKGYDPDDIKWSEYCTKRDKDFKDFMTGKGKYSKRNN